MTALAVEGYHRFLATQRVHEAAAPPGQPDRIVAAGQGYVAFATSHPALFRLMFASDRPDRSDPALQRAARGTEVRNHEEELHFEDGQVVRVVIANDPNRAYEAAGLPLP